MFYFCGMYMFPSHVGFTLRPVGLSFTTLVNTDSWLEGKHKHQECQDSFCLFFFLTFLTFFTLDLVIFIFPDNVSVRPFSYTQNRLEQNHRGCYAAIVFKCRTLFILAFSPPNKQLNNSLHITGLSILSHLSCLNWERGSWGIVTHHISALMWPVSPCLNPCALALSCTSRPSLLYVCVCVCLSGHMVLPDDLLQLRWCRHI